MEERKDGELIKKVATRVEARVPKHLKAKGVHADRDLLHEALLKPDSPNTPIKLKAGEAKALASTEAHQAQLKIREQILAQEASHTDEIAKQVFERVDRITQDLFQGTKYANMLQWGNHYAQKMGGDLMVDPWDGGEGEGEGEGEGGGGVPTLSAAPGIDGGMRDVIDGKPSSAGGGSRGNSRGSSRGGGRVGGLASPKASGTPKSQKRASFADQVDDSAESQAGAGTGGGLTLEVAGASQEGGGTSPPSHSSSGGGSRKSVHAPVPEPVLPFLAQRQTVKVDVGHQHEDEFAALMALSENHLDKVNLEAAVEKARPPPRAKTPSIEYVNLQTPASSVSGAGRKTKAVMGETHDFHGGHASGHGNALHSHGHAHAHSVPSSTHRHTHGHVPHSSSLAGPPRAPNAPDSASVGSGGSHSLSHSSRRSSAGSIETQSQGVHKSNGQLPIRNTASRRTANRQSLLQQQGGGRRGSRI